MTALPKKLRVDSLPLVELTVTLRRETALLALEGLRQAVMWPGWATSAARTAGVSHRRC